MRQTRVRTLCVREPGRTTSSPGSNRLSVTGVTSDARRVSIVKRTHRLGRVGSLIVIVVAAACGGPRPLVPCEQSSNCDLGGGGVCLNTSSGMWCAYPDPECPTGYRYSDQDIGGGVSGQCVDPDEAGNDAGIDAPPDADLRVWGAPTGVANVNSTADERQPAISANGLELYFWRGNNNPPYGEIFAASRTSTSQSFGSATAVTTVNTAQNENGVLIAHSGLELLVSQGNEIRISTRASAAAAWSPPVTTGLIAFSYSLTSNDLSLYLVKACQAGQHNGDGPCLYRSDRTAVGAAWSTPSFIEWPGGSLQWNYADVSGDGLRLLVSIPYSGSAVRAAESTRSTTGAAWGQLQIINALSLESTNQDMRWNADATEIYLTARPVIPAVGGSDIYVSVFQ